MDLPRESFVAAPADRVLTTRIGTGLALLDLGSSAYFSLDEVGTLVWEQLNNPRTLDALVAAVTREYDVDPQTCARDIAALVGELAEAGLLRLVASDTVV
ncbi:PqqD family protein [Devosia sp. Naph2]|uniref:PqqD family protein n=1 Tax=Devosia polycyclovorans TaxID=3345148 RepID=UPI0035CF0452